MSTLGLEYYWVYGDFAGRKIVLGPFQSEAQGNEEAYRAFDGAFEVVPLPTRDKSKAVGLLKGRRVHETGDIGRSIQRSMRKAPGEYKSRWWGEQNR